MKQMLEFAVAVAIVALATAFATDSIPLPYAATSSPFATVILVIAALGAFSVYPAAGLALFLLTAVLFFKRNVHTTMSKSTYGADSIRKNPIQTASPYESASSGPRSYNEFAETNPTNPMIGPVNRPVEGFEPAAYGDEAGAPVEGQYPTDEDRPQGESEPVDYMYRPSEDTGTNAFERYGPDMDEKKLAFDYSS